MFSRFMMAPHASGLEFWQDQCSDVAMSWHLGLNPAIRQAATPVLFLALLFTAGSSGLADDTAPHPADIAMVEAVGKALPAVVNINTEEITRARMSPLDAAFYDYFGQGATRPSGEGEQRRVQSLGSGFFIDQAGYILTNYHVVARAAEGRIHITTQGQQSFDARFITGDPHTDLALLQVIGSEPFPFISTADVSPNHLGQTVIVLGNPLGIGNTITRGVLSGLGREVVIDDIRYSNLVQTDAAINPGNSGGPMIDLNGKLVGVSSVKMAYTPQGVPAQGIGFAIPAQTARSKLSQFLMTASRLKESQAAQPVSSAWVYFGMHLKDLEANGSTGPVVVQLDPAGPAERAGLEPGMRIDAIGKYPVESSAALEELLSRVRQGVVVDFAVAPIGSGPGKNGLIRMTAR